jgi:ureidoglycolate lyase
MRSATVMGWRIRAGSCDIKAVSTATLSYPPTTGVRRVCAAPLVAATDASLAGYGCLVDDPRGFEIEITPWPAQGWRPIDPNTGDQGGVTQGLFEFAWRGQTLYATNHAVRDTYLFGWSTWPEEAAAEGPPAPRRRALVWRANYHPDGGQLVYPVNGESFVVPLALPGDDVTPQSFTAFHCDGAKGLYIRPYVWHGAFVPHADTATFLDRQGRVHARVSVDFAKEFGCYLELPLTAPGDAG